MPPSETELASGLVPQTVASSLGQCAGCLVCGGTGARQRFVQGGCAVWRCIDGGLEYVAPTPGPSKRAEYYHLAAGAMSCWFTRGA